MISLGGVIAGYNIKIKAPTVALSAGVVDMINKFIVDGDNADLGSVDLHDLLGAIPATTKNDPDQIKWASAVGNGVNELNMPPVANVLDQSLFSAPVLAAGSNITLDPTTSFSLGSTSRITATGRGGSGGAGASEPGGKPHGEAPGGARDEFGGSHGGYGGYVGSTVTQSESWGIWQDRQGRGPTTDDPFEPSLPGSGGAGDDDVSWGANGGGVIAIKAPKAKSRIDGRIDADGNGINEEFDENDTGSGGAGAGGSVYVTTKDLAGGGQISADGGGYCPDCINGFGGMGGGGRISLVSTTNSKWTGTAHAHGGVDQQYPGLDTVYPGNDEGYFAGTGGAGTVFTRQVKFSDKGYVASGLGEFSEGTLTVDGGRLAGAYPPPDGTPIADAWGDAHRRLVLKGEARAYAEKPDFEEIDVLGGSNLTTEYGTRTLKVTADSLKVDANSRIDMSTRGYAGGPNGYNSDDPKGGAAETAPGQTPAVRDYGGSHGGAGGAPSGYLYPKEGDRPGSTYDSVRNPSLPGGGGAGDGDTERGDPGGGVLDVNAKTLQLDGQLSADGSDTNGPNLDDPTPFSIVGGAGAGGSVLVHASVLRGSGSVKADGGWACLTGNGPPLVPGGLECNFGSSGSSGAGGGGRVAVYAHPCSWTGSLSAKGGIAQNSIGSDDAAQTTGAAGSKYFSEVSGNCSPQGRSKQAKLKIIRIRPKRLQVKGGGKVMVRITGKNVGGAGAKGARLCLVVGKKMKKSLTFQGGSCRRLGSIKPKKSRTGTFRLKATRKARKGRIYRVQVGFKAGNARNVKKYVKIKVH